MPAEFLYVTYSTPDHNKPFLDRLVTATVSNTQTRGKAQNLSVSNNTAT